MHGQRRIKKAKPEILKRVIKEGKINRREAVKKSEDTVAESSSGNGLRESRENIMKANYDGV